MEEEIQEILEEIYKHVLCKVEFVTFRKYKITIILDYLTTKELVAEIDYTYDSRSTFDCNITNIENLINKQIIKLMKGE